MHAIKFYGPLRGGKIRTAPHGARTGSVSERTFCLKQQMNSPATARTGPGVWCDVSVISNHGPRTILAPVRFLSCEAEWSARGDFTLSWSHQVIWHSCTPGVWSNNWQDSTWTPCTRRTDPARESPVFSYPTGSVRGPCGTHKGAARHTYGHVRELAQQEFAKIPHGCRMWSYGACACPLRSPPGLFMGYLRSLNPHGGRKLIMHALKLYGPRTGGKIRKAPHGARTGPMSGRTIFVQSST